MKGGEAMSYDFYINGTLFPVSPEKLTIKHNGQNKTVTLINDGEVNMIKTEGLQDISGDFLLPNVQYPFARYLDGFHRAKYYTDILQHLMDEKKTFQFIVARALPGGTALDSTNIKCTLEEWSPVEQSKDGFDVTVSVKLKQYREYGTKTFQVNVAKHSMSRSGSTRSGKSTGGGGKTYTVKKGDCLWKISRQFYGKGSSYPTIYNANKGVVGGNPNLIYPGQKLTIP